MVLSVTMSDPSGPLGEAHLALFAFFVPFDRRWADGAFTELGDGFTKIMPYGKLMGKSKNIRKMIGK